VKIYTREDAERIKPDPQIHEKLLAEMGKKPEDCFIFEDSLIGVRAAKAAGIPVAAIYDNQRSGGYDLRFLCRCPQKYVISIKTALTGNGHNDNINDNV
jgi:beta-phosphoglucomutase-like phosphatase (HAD superfamily)